jgi:four helix bundle protein
MQFAVRLVRFCRTLPPTWEARQLGSQLLSSGTSVAMNYRAATRGRSRAEFIAKLGIVVEEADESVGWLELIEQIELAKGSEFSWLLSESKELLAIFGSAQRTAKENHQRQRSVNHPINRPSPDRTSPNSSNRTSPNRKS